MLCLSFLLYLKAYQFPIETLIEQEKQQCLPVVIKTNNSPLLRVSRLLLINNKQYMVFFCPIISIFCSTNVYPIIKLHGNKLLYFQYIAFLDLAQLAQFSSKRRKQIFSLTQPGTCYLQFSL